MKNKKIIILLGILFIVAMLVGLVACNTENNNRKKVFDIEVKGFDFDVYNAEIIDVGDYIYLVSKGNAVILEYTGDEQRIIVPEQVTNQDKTYAVKGIASKAFNGLDSTRQLFIPDSVIFAEESIVDEDCVAQIFVPWQTEPLFWSSFWKKYKSDIRFNFEKFSSTEEYDYYQYKDNTIELCKYKGNQKDIVIPSYIDGNAVTYFGQIFSDIDGVRSITIPDTIKYINHVVAENYNSDMIFYIEASKEDTSLWSQFWNWYKKDDSFNQYDGQYLTYFDFDSFGSDNEYDYIIHNDGAVTITKYKGNDTQLIVPKQIDGHDVVGIGKAILQDDAVKTIELHDGIQMIYEKAFNTTDDLTIYCHAPQRPKEWDALWNMDEDNGILDVVWNVLKRVSDDSFDYTIKNDGYVYIEALKTTDAELFIPDEVDGYPVRYMKYGLLFNQNQITKISVPQTLEYSDKELFATNAMKEFEYRGTLSDWLSMQSFPRFKAISLDLIIDGELLQGEINIPQNITGIRDYAFASIRNITGVKFHDEITSIGQYAFVNCKDLQSVSLPDSVTQIGNKSFASANLQSVVLSQNITEIPEGAFNDNELKYIEIPASVKVIGEYAFANNDIESITLNEGLIEIDKFSFLGCHYLVNIDFPSTLTAIGDYAFASCTVLSDVVLSARIKNLGERVFDSDYNAKIFCNPETKPDGWSEYWDVLESVEGKEITRHNVFWGFDTASQNESYEYIVKNNQVYLLNYIADETQVVVPDEIEGMPVVCVGQAFKGNPTVTSVVLGDNITYIYQYAFANCSALTQVTMSDNIKEIRRGAFGCCRALSQITIPQNLEIIGESAFQECNSLKSFQMPQNLKEIGENAFYWSGLREITLNSNLNRIGSGAFINTSLTRLDLPQSITNLGGDIFSKYFESMEIYYAGTIQDWLNIQIEDICFNGICEFYINGQCLDGELVIPQGITNISAYAFAGTKITSVILPEGLVEIDNYAFLLCNNLESIVFANTIERIGSGAFSHCDILNNIQLPQNLKIIENYAFSDCKALAQIVLPYSLTDLDYYAFNMCVNLTDVYIPDCEIDIHNYVFNFCDNLTVHCAQQQKPDSWASDWNKNTDYTITVTVEWGYDPNND